MIRRNGSAPGKDEFDAKLMELIANEFGKKNILSEGNAAVISHKGMIMSIWMDEKFVALECDILDPSGEPVTITENEISNLVPIIARQRVSPSLYTVPDSDGYGLHHSFTVGKDNLRNIGSILDIIDNMFFACFYSSRMWNMDVNGIDPYDSEE